MIDGSDRISTNIIARDVNSKIIDWFITIEYRDVLQQTQVIFLSRIEDFDDEIFYTTLGVYIH